MAVWSPASRKLLVGALGLAAGVAVPSVAFADKEKDKKEKDNARGPMFDPEALERGAKALREINQSPFGKQVIELTRVQEATKQSEYLAQAEQAKAHAAQLNKEREQLRFQEERQLEEQRAQVGARMKQYEDELTRKRMLAEHELQRQRNAEMVKLQEEAAARQEGERLRVEQQIQAERRAAEAYAADMQKQIQRERALAEAEGRAKEARENEDVNRRAALLKYSEEGKAAIEYLNVLMANLGNAAIELLTDRNKLATTLGATGAVFALLFGTREGARVVGGAVERWLGTPQLVRETSRFSIWKPSTWRTAPAKGADEIKRDFSDIILPGGLHNNVRMLAASAANTRKHGAPFRHMLFYGPPGTGKTMAAKRLARTSGLDYAIMSGGDVAPLEGKAVTQLHQTFDWAERSPRGLLLFIDEADAFLGRRSDAMSEGLRGALNALLFRTGDQSRDFMVVIATNRPGDLDDAVLDRMDEALEFGLPGHDERLHMLQLYLDKYIVKAGTAEGEVGTRATQSPWERLQAMLRGRKASADRIAVHPAVEGRLPAAAKAMQGFSGREIAKFLAAVQAAAYGGAQPELTPELWDSVLARKLYEHKERSEFRLGHHGTGSSQSTNMLEQQLAASIKSQMAVAQPAT